MRKLLLLALLAPLAACELQPGPPRPTAQSAPPPPSAATPPAPTPPTAPTPTEAPPNAAPTNPKKVPIEITPQCLDTATHVASVIIASADPAQRSIFENERDRIVRSTAEVCTTQNWSDAAARCYKAASTQADLKTCETKFPSQPAATPPRANPAEPVTKGGMRPEPGTPGVAPGSGSAAPTRPGAGTGSAAPARPSTGAGSAAPLRPTPRPARAGSGSAR